jgi:carboxylesterase type B
LFVSGCVCAGEEILADGTSILTAANNSAIYIAGNYRLGAYGFLAGTSVERSATPNAALWDQHAVFRWVQSYAPLFGGDKDNVSAWGESAGGGSLVHHLVFEGGKMDPLFKRAVVQSPAFDPQWDRRGKLEGDFQRFAAAAGCGASSITDKVGCLRGATEADIKKANAATIAKPVGSTFAYGPAPDGSLIRQLPGLEYAQGNVWKGLESVISQHVRDEAIMFTYLPPNSTDASFTPYLQSIYPNSSARATFVDAITKFYPSSKLADSPYKTLTQRVSAFTRDSSFTCNNRFVAAAYPGKSWELQYSAMGGTHGSDVSATFYKPGGFFPNPGAVAYQSYLISHALTGDPNTLRKKATTIEWPKASGFEGENIKNTLNVLGSTGSAGFKLIDDSTNLKDHCDFWLGLWGKAAVMDKYVPAPAPVQSV